MRHTGDERSQRSHFLGLDELGLCAAEGFEAFVQFSVFELDLCGLLIEQMICLFTL
jgi:hypothetical protein